MFEPGWLQVELDAAAAEVASWSPGMRRVMDHATISMAEDLIRKSLGRFGQDVSKSDLRSAAIKLASTLPRTST